MHMHMICIKCKLYHIAQNDTLHSNYFRFQWFCGVGEQTVAIIDNKLHHFVYFKTLWPHCCEVIIKIHELFAMLHTYENTVKLLTCFLIQCLHVSIDMWSTCLAAGRMIFTVKRTCRKPQTWVSGWLPYQTIFFYSIACVIDYSFSNLIMMIWKIISKEFWYF